jgi:cell shape-determining protein MreC
MSDLFNTKQKIVFWFCSIVVFILLALFVGGKIFSAFSSGGRFLGVVVWKAKDTIETTSEFARLSLHSKKELINEVISLRDEALSQENKLTLLSSLSSEVEDLKKILNRGSSEQYVVASILTRPPQSLYDTFIIDIGSQKGVTVGDVVSVDGTFVVGTIESTQENTSLVSLFSTPGTSHEAYISDIGISLVIKGKGNGTFVAEVPRDILIEEGMSVLSAGINTQSYGVVKNVDSDPRDPTKRILIEGPLTLQHVRLVGVLLSNTSE